MVVDGDLDLELDGHGICNGIGIGVAGVAAGAIYKRSARISAGGTALPIKRVATTRPSGNTKLSGRPWSRASSRTCSSRACVPSCHTYTALVVDTVGARPSSSYMRECWVLRRR